MKRLGLKNSMIGKLSLVFFILSLLMATTASAQRYELNTMGELQMEGKNSNYVNEINKIAQQYPDAEYTVTYENGKLKDVSVTGIEDELVKKHLEVVIFNLKNNKLSNEPEQLGVFYTVDKKARYKDGDIALHRAIQNHLNYPQDALDWGADGTIYVKFVIDENGNIPYITTSDNLNTNLKRYKKELDQQAINAVESTSGKWIPSQKDGVNVASFAVVPIKFEDKLNPGLIAWVQ